MSLLDDVKKVIDNEVSSLRGDCIEDYVDDVTLVEDICHGSGRWTEHWTAIVQRGNEFVGIDYELPSTEYQEGSEGDSEAYPVEPYEVTVTKYRKVQ